MKKRILSAILTFAMVLGLFNGLGWNLTVAKGDEPSVVSEGHVHQVCGEETCSGHPDGTVHSTSITYAHALSIDENDNVLVDGKLVEVDEDNYYHLPSGSYYLTNDQTATKAYAAIRVGYGNVVNLCLNGHTLSGESLEVYTGTLNICDCGGNGTVIGGLNPALSTGNSTSVLNVYGGTFRGNDAVGISQSQKVTIYDGNFSGISNGLKLSGGPMQTVALEILGGSFTTDSEDGAALSLSDDHRDYGPVLHTMDVTISGGTFTNTAAGGKAVKTEDYSGHGLIRSDNIVEGGYFWLDANDNIVDPLAVSYVKVGTVSYHRHLECGAYGANCDGHADNTSHSADIEYKSLSCNGNVVYIDGVEATKGTNGNYQLPTGNYYLVQNESATRDIEVPAGAVVNLCLNGQILSSKNVKVYGTLKISDCDRESDGKITSSGTIGISTDEQGKIVVYQANIEGNYGINVTNGSLVVYDGTVTGKAYGGIWVNNGSLVIYDGTFTSNGTYETSGFALCTENKQDVIIYNGTFTGKRGGARIAVNSGYSVKVDIRNGHFISEGSSAAMYIAGNLTSLPSGTPTVDIKISKGDFKNNSTGKAFAFGIYIPINKDTVLATGSYWVDADGKTVDPTKASYAEVIDRAPHTHVWATEWSSNVTAHWHKCTASDCDIEAAGGDYSQVAESGYKKHTADTDDGSCLTAVLCKDCKRQLTAAETSHSYTYTVSGNVITEKCGRTGCTVHNATATITAPAGSLISNGTKKFEAGVQYSSAWTAGKSHTVTYTRDSIATADLTKPGKYVASMTVGDKTASVSYTVTSPGSVTITSDISKIYDGSAVEEPVYTKDGTGDAIVEYKVRDADDSTYSQSAPADAGDYTVRVTVAADDIYGAAFATKDFTIVARSLVEDDFTVNTTGFVYNGNAFEPIVNSKNTLVTDADYTVVYNNNIEAGENTAEIQITGKNNASGVVTIKFTIAKAEVTAPTIDSKTYTGQTLIADVPDSTLYTVGANAGGIDVAENYVVELKLTDSKNYKWSSTDDATVTLQFAITQATNAWTTNPSITGWTYKEQESAPAGEASFGNVEFTYYDSTQVPLGAKPTNAGSYYMKATVADGGANYNGLNSGFIPFTIEKAVVTVPAAPASKVYTGSVLTADMAETSLYTVEKNVGGTDVDTYDVVLKLKDSANYEWSSTTDATVTLKFAITKAINEWTVDPDIADWCYDEEAKSPVGTAKFGEVVFTYYDSDEAPLSEKPSTAGTYYMKASVAAGGNNYDAISTEFISFAITAAANSWTTIPGIAGWTYGETASTPVGKAKYGTPQFTYYTYDDSQYQELSAQPTTAGTYYMKASVPADGIRYSAIESDYIQFTIEKAVPETGFPAGLHIGTVMDGGKTTLAKIDLTGFTGYAWDEPTTQVAYGSYSYAMTFTPADTVNYKVVQQNVTVVGDDVTSPTGKITIADNEWTTLINSFTFGLFFKETQTVTVTAADTESGVAKTEYFLSKQEVGEETQWTEFENSFNIDPNNQYVVYVRITDGAGNAVIINSDGVVLDNIAPALSGIVNGGTYYQQVVVTVTDSYFDKVEVNGQPVAVTIDNQFTLTASSQQQTVKAYDKAGNISAEMIVLVEENHTAYQWGEAVDNGDGTYTQIGACACGHILKVTASAKADSPVAGLEEEAEAQGKDLKLEIETDVEKIDSAEMEAIQEKMRDDETALFLDITLKDAVGDNKISITNNVLEIPVAFDFAGKMNVTVYRKHLNVVQRFQGLESRPTENFRDGSYFADEMNDVIYVYTNLFSTYSVAYHAHTAKEVPAKAATAGADGNIRHWICEGCNKYFADAAAVREITQAETIVKYVAPKPESKPESKPQNKPEGNKTPISQAPMTGDTANMVLWLTMLCISGMGVITVTIFSRKRRVSR